MIHDAEGTYNHERKAVLITVITRAEFNEFKQIMKQGGSRCLCLCIRECSYFGTIR